MPEKQSVKKNEIQVCLLSVIMAGCRLFVTVSLSGFPGSGLARRPLGVELGPAGPTSKAQDQEEPRVLVVANQMSVERRTLVLDLGFWR